MFKTHVSFYVYTGDFVKLITSQPQIINYKFNQTGRQESVTEDYNSTANYQNAPFATSSC
jgi:hypothetical protein